MIAAQQQSLTLVADRARLKSHVLRRAADEPQIDRTLFHAGDDFCDRLDRCGDRDPRMALRQRMQQLRRRLIAGTGAVRDHDFAALARPVGSDAAPQLVGRAQQRRSALEQEFARLGQLELVRGPVQQVDSELLLEQPHLAAQRRLGDVQPLGRAREVSFLRDRDEVLQPTEIGHRTDASRESATRPEAR